MRKIIYNLIVLVCLATTIQAQPPKRAIRGVWVATVDNIDWPTKKGLPVGQQQQEMVGLLDKMKACNMNTLVFQIRPTADALYKSHFEPASHWITGEQGADMGYDPLQFTIDECRKRGFNIHVWLNPYRVSYDTAAYNNYAASHIKNKHPEWIVPYGKAIYFNPGLDEVRKFTCDVVKDIVSNYDIDAIHMDDYFYPYKIAGQEFPDSLTFAAHPRGFADKGDWRRNNVNLIIKEIGQTIKSVKPWVEFGISPFAIWRNKKDDPRGSDTKGGTSNYDGLYADILLWQKEGWIDYVLPQLYFNIGYEVADYAVLADWWSAHNYGANVYAGLAPYRVSKTAKQKEWHNPKELVRQIRRNQADPNLKGEVYFSAKSLFNSPFDIDKLVSKEYKTLTISPENPRIARIEPQSPQSVQMKGDGSKNELTLSWSRGKDAKRFVIYKFERGKPVNIDNPKYIVAVTGEDSVTLPYKGESDLKKYRYAVSALSPSHTESAVVYFE